MAVLDAIICPEAESRQFRFEGPYAPAERVASYDNYEGDSWLIWFTVHGAVVRGFWHESPWSPWALSREAPTPRSGLFVGLPRELQNGPRMLIDGVQAVTFCLWWDVNDPRWRTGPLADPVPGHADPDGSQWLLGVLSGVDAYREHVEEIYESRVPSSALVKFFRHDPLTPEMVRAVDGRADVEQVMTLARVAGYPLGA
jgi:hypothetical protein